MSKNIFSIESRQLIMIGKLAYSNLSTVGFLIEQQSISLIRCYYFLIISKASSFIPSVNIIGIKNPSLFNIFVPAGAFPEIRYPL
ncbi:hypothetical protein EZS27_010424 [termite gut metagenome]|uniref:Uncharacterized protein n=1 Tax=termite gut metagenome TaxID=433724 RepID=A0A5J4S6R7_9ZZZZ